MSNVEQRDHQFLPLPPMSSDIDEDILMAIAGLVPQSPGSAEDTFVYSGPCNFVVSCRTGEKLKHCRESFYLLQVIQYLILIWIPKHIFTL